MDLPGSLVPSGSFFTFYDLFCFLSHSLFFFPLGYFLPLTLFLACVRHHLRDLSAAPCYLQEAVFCLFQWSASPCSTLSSSSPRKLKTVLRTTLHPLTLLSLPQATSSVPREKKRKRHSLPARKSKVDKSPSPNTPTHPHTPTHTLCLALMHLSSSEAPRYLT